MDASSARWRVVQPSEHQGEQLGLAYLKQHLPDRPPYYAWSNLTFSGADRSLNEVDLLVLGPAGLFLVELKGWRQVSGSSQHWRVNNAADEVQNPLLLANLKAKRLRGLLQDGARRHDATLQVPWIEPAVFLHHPDLVVELDEHGRPGVYGPHATDPQLPGIVTDLLTRPAAQPARAVDQALSDRVAALLDKLGFTGTAASTTATAPEQAPVEAPPTWQPYGPMVPVVTGPTWDRLEGPGDDWLALSMAIKPDSALVASGVPIPPKQWGIALFDAHTAERWITPARYDNPPQLDFSPDGRLLAAGDRSVQVWNVGTWTKRAELPTRGGRPKAVAFSPDRSYLACAEDATVHVWDVGGWHEITKIAVRGSAANAVTFSPDSGWLAATCSGLDYVVGVWRTSDWQVVQTLDARRIHVESVAFSPDGHLLAGGCFGGTIVIWSTSTWTELTRLTGYSQHVNSVAFSPDGRFLAAGCEDNQARIWSTADWSEVATMTPGDNYVKVVAFSSDSRLLAVVNGRLHLFHVPQ